MNSPTLTAHATQLGVILGTAAYVRAGTGERLNRSIGAPTSGPSASSSMKCSRAVAVTRPRTCPRTLAAVLTREVDWSALPAGLPPRLHTLLRDCLVRDPKQRLRDIGDARRALDQIISGAPDAAAGLAPAAPPPSRRTGIVPWAVAGLALIGAVALAFVHFREAPAPRQLVRFTILPPDKTSFGGFALSPDGRYLAFVTSEGSVFGVQGTSKLWVRAIGLAGGTIAAGD
jgi:hypothetical protein